MAAPGPVLVNFAPVGLNFQWRNDAASQAALANEAALLPTLAVVDDSNLSVSLQWNAVKRQMESIFDADIPGAPGIPGRLSRIVMNGRTYKVITNKGSGTYGIVAHVEEVPAPGAAPGAAPRVFALKRQDTRVSNFLPFIKEGIVHYTLYRRTRNAAFESDYVPNFYYMGRRDHYMYFLTELMENHLLGGRLTPTNGNRDLQARFILDFLTQITPLLRFLYDNFNYNHGDFKCDNVMYNATGRYKLIDFGFSRLRINGRVIETTPEFCNASEESRDLTQVMRSMIDWTQLDLHFQYPGAGPVSIKHKLYEVLFQTVLAESVCSGKHGHHEAHFRAMQAARMHWFDTYYNFNTPSPAGTPPGTPERNWIEGHTNMAGTFDAVAGYLAWIASPNSDIPGAPVQLAPSHIATLTEISNNADPTFAGQRAYAQGMLAALAAPAVAPAAPAVAPAAPAVAPAAPAVAPAAPAAAVIPAPPPPPGLLDRMRANAGTVAFGVALAAIAAYQVYLYFAPPGPQEGGKKVKRRTQKNRKRVQRHVWKKQSRKRSF